MERNHGGNTLHQLEEELQTSIYPGTEIMSDVAGHPFVKSGKGSDRVLVPQPSSDPHDPLNWNRFWKTTAMSLSTAVTIAQTFGPPGLAPIFPDLMKTYHRDLTDVVQFAGVCILVLGFSNFIWVPIMTTFGRRPTLIFSTLICLASSIWRAVAKDYKSALWACVLNGIGAGPGEVAQPTIIADVIFLHERGAYNTLYFTCNFGALMVAPIISGAIAHHSNWRNYWWLNVALHAVILVLLIFLFPETMWHKTHPRAVIARMQNPSPDRKTSDTAMIADPENHNTPSSEKNAAKDATSDSTADKLVAPTPYLHTGAPSRQQFQLWQPSTNTLKTLFTEFWIPWKLLTFPIVEFSAFVVSWSASCILTVNLTQSQNFAAPPYRFSSQTIGFLNFAPLVGTIIGLVTNGRLSDWVAARATRNNRGIREPEMRLPVLIPYVLIMILGNFTLAFGYQHKWDWRVIVIIGYACVGIQVAAVPAIASTYGIDSYKPVAGSIFVAITVNKNLWGYGMSKFITHWIISSGYIPPIMLNMCLTLFFCSFGVLFYYKGKTFRKWTRNSIVHDL